MVGVVGSSPIAPTNTCGCPRECPLTSGHFFGTCGKRVERKSLSRLSLDLTNQNARQASERRHVPPEGGLSGPRSAGGTSGWSSWADHPGSRRYLGVRRDSATSWMAVTGQLSTASGLTIAVPCFVYHHGAAHDVEIVDPTRVLIADIGSECPNGGAMVVLLATPRCIAGHKDEAMRRPTE
jgi:hypothetical protein